MTLHPPQGYGPANTLVAGLTVQIDSNGRLGFFNSNGIELFYFDANGNHVFTNNSPSEPPNFALGMGSGGDANATILSGGAGVNSIILRSNGSNIIEIGNQSLIFLQNLSPNAGNTGIGADGAAGDLLLNAPSGKYVEIRNAATSLARFGSTGLTRFLNVPTVGVGVGILFGLDNRSGITSADGAPITLYPVPSGAGQLFRITMDIFATTFSSGTATYTITWTQNSGARTLAVTSTVLNTLGTATDLINPDQSTNITVQLTGVFSATVDLAALVEKLA